MGGGDKKLRIWGWLVVWDVKRLEAGSASAVRRLGRLGRVYISCIGIAEISSYTVILYLSIFIAFVVKAFMIIFVA